MQTTEKLDVPFQSEINHLAKIQVQQSEQFKCSLKQQSKFFNSAYQSTLKSYYSNNQLELIKKIELVDFMFSVHMESFNLPSSFVQTFNLLKIITTKSALFHSAFFINSHNPVAHYLRSASSHISQKLNKSNKAECLKLLNENIQLLIIKYQSDPSFFDLQTKSIINTFKLTKALKTASNASSPALKTSSLKDNFSRNVSHINVPNKNKTNNVYLFSAKNVKQGDWVNLKQKNKTDLIKLIWKADDNSEFIFVNKNGEKVRQCSLIELAADFENDVISLVSNNSSNTLKRNNSVLKTIG